MQETSVQSMHCFRAVFRRFVFLPFFEGSVTVGHFMSFPHSIHNPNKTARDKTPLPTQKTKFSSKQPKQHIPGPSNMGVLAGLPYTTIWDLHWTPIGWWRYGTCLKKQNPPDPSSNKKLLGAKGIATNGARTLYVRGSWPYY